MLLGLGLGLSRFFAGGGALPASALRDRTTSPILDRFGANINVRT